MKRIESNMKYEFGPMSGEFMWGYEEGWKACKQEVLKILQQDYTGLDMSPNSCDSWYIDRIKEL